MSSDVATKSSLLSSLGSAAVASPPGDRWVLMPGSADISTLRSFEDFRSRPEGKTSSVRAAIVPPSRLLGRALLGQPLRGSKRGPSASSLPPTLETSVESNHVYRFLSTSGSAKVVSFGTMLGAMGGICTVANTTIKSFHSSMKIMRVTVWSAASSSTEEGVQLFWESGTSSQIPDEAKISSIPQGVTVTKALVFVPPEKSLAADWLSAAANLFSIQSPVGSIVDVHVVGRLSNVFASVASTVGTATLGSTYYLSLDGGSSGTYVAQGLPTTV